MYRKNFSTTHLLHKQKAFIGFNKFAVEPIKKRQNFVKYGEVIGQAAEDIAKGRHVHVHIVESLRGRGDLS